MEPTRLQLAVQSGVGTIMLSRPEVHNAFDDVLIAELTEVFLRWSEDATLRAIVIAGAGPSFCAGADLAYMGRMIRYTREENREDACGLERMFAAIAQCPKVTLAKVHGAAIGGGAGLAAVCDIVIAAEEARFAFSEARLGLAPAVIGPYVLAKIGMGAARMLFVTGERITAAEAERIGLVQQVVPAADLDAAVARKTELILQTGPAAVAAIKHLLQEIAGKEPSAVADLTADCIAALRVSPEGQEGIRAFLEKRRPDFAPPAMD